MNLNHAIKELLAEKDRLDRAIARLEAMQKGKAGVTAPPQRRGRRTMDAKARREVSERMRRYWAARRQQQSPENPPGP